MGLYQHFRSGWNLDRVALVTPNGHTTTYRELDERVRRAAGFLNENGVRDGDTIALQLPKSTAFLDLHLAALALGVTTLPLHTKAPEARVKAMVDETRPVWSSVGEDPDALDRSIAAATPVHLPQAVSDDAVAVRLYTSGTTAKPKAVPLSHANLAVTLRGLHERWNMTPADRLIHALPITHVHGLVVAQHGALWAGATTVWLDGFDAERMVQTVHQQEATILMGVPTFYERLCALHDAKPLPSLRLATSGSAPLPVRVFDAFERLYGLQIVERYGMTEVGIVLANAHDAPRRGAVGYPLPGVSVRVVPSDDTPYDEDSEFEEGELAVAGPGVFHGYANATSDALRGGWMYTGDLVRKHADGCFSITGRKSEIVNVGGFNVSPAAVEEVLQRHESVDDAVVFPVPDGDRGEAPAAIIKGRANLGDLAAFAAARLAPYERPIRWFREREIPVNEMGKRQRSALRVAYGPRLTQPTWPRSLAGHVEDMVRAHENDECAPLAALDWDHTCIRGDISETVLAMLSEGVSPSPLDHYKQETSRDLREGFLSCARWLLGGKSENEVAELSRKAWQWGSDHGRLHIRSCLLELSTRLQQYGWQVWIVTASPAAIVRAHSERLNVPPSRVIGMTTALDAEGRFTQREVEPIPFAKGKADAFVVATGRSPDFAAGDSTFDLALLDGATDALWIDRGSEDGLAHARRKGWWVANAEELQ